MVASVIKCRRENDDLFEEQSDKLFRYSTLCTNTLKWEFGAKRIEPTWFIFTEVPGVPQF